MKPEEFIKKYRAIGGFEDGTDFVAVDEDGFVFTVDFNGIAEWANYHTERKCDKFVKKGIWILL